MALVSFVLSLVAKIYRNEDLLVNKINHKYAVFLFLMFTFVVGQSKLTQPWHCW